MTRINAFLLFFLLAASHSLASNDLKIEPPHWWVGMENEHLQIMVQGHMPYCPSIDMDDYPGVEFIGFSQPKENYFFIDLDISSEAEPGTLSFEIFCKGPQVFFEYELKPREEGSRERTGFNSSDAIYLITPDRFANGNPQNDNADDMKEKSNRGFHGGRHGGDVQGMIDHLDYIADMGFTALWINPILENNMDSWSYHGYSTTDFYRIDPRYGTLDEYKELVAEADKRDIKVIQDMIENHCGSRHWWMNDLPFDDWINNKGEYEQTSHRHEVIQDPYASEFDKKAFSDGWFVRTMPDLNQRNPFLSKYLIQNSIWWIEEVGLSGVRQDTYPYADKEFMAQWSKAIMTEYPEFNIVGEEWNYDTSRVAYWQRGNQNKDGYESSLPSMMDFPLQKAICDAMNMNNAQGEGLLELYRCLAKDYLYADPNNLVVFADNHDMDRFYARIDEDLESWKMGMAYLMVTRGIPQIFYGTEILMSNGDNGEHGIIRSDFPGGWTGDDVNAFTGSGLTPEQIEAQKFLRKLLNWRKVNSAIHEGRLVHFAPSKADPTYTLVRSDEEKIILLIMNPETEAKEVATGKFAEILFDYRNGYDVLSENEFAFEEGFIAVPARGFRLIEIER